MYDQIRGDVIFIMLYAIAMAQAMASCCYLLFRRGNAFADDITPPLRLRRWTAALFGFIVLNHLWYMPLFFLDSEEEVRMVDFIGGLLDGVTFFPLAIIVLLAMLQDRRRPLWHVAVLMMPVLVISALSFVIPFNIFLPLFWWCFLLMSVSLIVYLLHAVRQYGRWLRENYADLEHKEVWQSIVVIIIVLLVFGVYAFTGEGPVYQYAMRVIILVLVSYLLWRVETLSDLSLSVSEAEEAEVAAAGEEEMAATTEEEKYISSLSFRNYIGPMLKQHCEEPELYLQYDLSLSSLARQVGINRTYLSRYFSMQGITYNAYINGLRIQYFMKLYTKLYRETDALQKPQTVQQLASQSGFRSYSTFSGAFKQMMGMTPTEWMRNLKK